MERIPLYKIVNINHVLPRSFILGTIRPGKPSSSSYCRMVSELGREHTMATNNSATLGQEVILIGYAVIKSIK